MRHYGTAPVTEHRKKEDRIREILDAAAAEIEVSGYPGLTMDAIVRRTSLSKGGVYRFFKNRRDVVLALFRRTYSTYLDFDLDEALSWNQPIQETMYLLLFERENEKERQRNQRIWVELVAETLRDPVFRNERTRLVGLAARKFGDLAKKLLERDGRWQERKLRRKLESALWLGITLMEGLTFQGPSGLSTQAQATQIRHFIEVIIHDAFDRESSVAASATKKSVRRTAKRFQRESRP